MIWTQPSGLLCLWQCFQHCLFYILWLCKISIFISVLSGVNEGKWWLIRQRRNSISHFRGRYISMMDNTSWWPRAIHDVIVLILARSRLASTATLSFVHRELWLQPGPTCNVYRIGDLMFCRLFFYIYRQVENVFIIVLPEWAVTGTPRAPHCNKGVKFDRYPTLMNSNLFQRTPEQQKKQKYYKYYI